MSEITPGEAAFIGAGDVYIAAIVNGVTLGERFVGNVPEFVIGAPDIDEKVLTGRTTKTYAQDIKTVNVKVSQELSMTLNDIVTKQNFEVATYGDSSDTAQTAGNDSTPVNVKVYTDEWTQLAHMNLSTTTKPVVKDATGVTTYVEGADYEIDYVYGRIKGLGAGITSGATCQVTCTWLAITGSWKVTANQDLTKEVQVRLIGEDQANDAKVVVIVPRVQIKPMGDISMIGDDFAELKVGGKIMPDADGKSWSITVLGTLATS